MSLSMIGQLTNNAPAQSRDLDPNRRNARQWLGETLEIDPIRVFCAFNALARTIPSALLAGHPASVKTVQ